MMNINSGNYSNNTNTVIGDHNVVTFNSNIAESEWELMRKELRTLLRKLPEDSSQLEHVENLQSYVIHKDEKGLKAYIKRNINNFNIGVLSSITSGFLMKLIESICNCL